MGLSDVFLIKPDALEEFESEIKDELEAAIEGCEATIERYVKTQFLGLTQMVLSSFKSPKNVKLPD